MDALGYSNLWNVIDDIMETERDIVEPDFEGGVYSGGKATAEQVVCWQELDHDLHNLIDQAIWGVA